MDTKEFKALLKQQKQEIVAEVTKDTKRYVRTLKQEIVAEVTEETQRYIGALKEDFDHKLDAVLEVVSVLPDIQQKLDATFEKVGEIVVDIDVIKTVVKDHEHRIQKLEARA